jgi:glycosyltransferase involved in cell wall biosynthesis
LPDFVVIVDDNQDKNEFEIILERVNKLNNPNILCIHHFKTKNNSGTGTWNSGIEFLKVKFKDTRTSYIAILDDDDEWIKPIWKNAQNKYGQEEWKTRKPFLQI